MNKQRIEIEVDVEELDAIQQALGTEDYSATVAEALKQLVLGHPRRRVTRENLERFAEATADLRDPEVMAGA